MGFGLKPEGTSFLLYSGQFAKLDLCLDAGGPR